jgi:hypothetical protein
MSIPFTATVSFEPERVTISRTFTEPCWGLPKVSAYDLVPDAPWPAPEDGVRRRTYYDWRRGTTLLVMGEDDDCIISEFVCFGDTERDQSSQSIERQFAEKKGSTR